MRRPPRHTRFNLLGMRYLVLCQDAVGHKTEIVVHATTDERACNAALRTLNSWKAVRAVPTVLAPPRTVVLPPVEYADESEEDVETADEPETSIGRIVHKTTVTDLVRNHRGKLGNLGRALRQASEERSG